MQSIETTGSRHTSLVLTSEQPLRQDVSLGWTAVLHLIPGTLALVFCLLTEPFIVRLGFPAAMTFNVYAVVVLIPVELGILLFLGKRRNGRFSLQGIVLNRQPSSLRTYVLVVPPMLVWSAVILAVVSPPVEAALKTYVFAWMPHWLFTVGTLNPTGSLARPLVLATALGNLVIDPLTAFVEEWYFRGFLLPRLGRLRSWAPFVNAVLFSFQHLTTPWKNPLRLVALTPLVYAVAWKRNLYLSVLVHVTLNLLAGVLVVLPLLK